jgi:hypothetical protein
MSKVDDFDPTICQKMMGKREISFFLNPKLSHLARKSKNLLSIERKQVFRKIFLNFRLKREYRSQQE